MSLKPRRKSQHRGGGGYSQSDDDLDIPLDSTSVIRKLVYSDQDSRRLQLRRVDTVAATTGNVSASSSLDSDDLMFENEGVGGGYVDGTKMSRGIGGFSYSGDRGT